MLILAKKVLYLPRYPLLWIIFLYQKTLSPDHSFWAKWFFPHGYCKFHPTCSEYGYTIIKKRGIFIGVPKAAWRILRCNPWNPGGIDLPE
jgi:hypothetical protein